MEKFRLGYIGKNEIAKAIEVLEENTGIKNIFVEVSHNNEVRGAEYDDMLELLSDEDFVYYFANKKECLIDLDDLGDYEGLNSENLDLLNTFSELFENGGVYCDFENKRFSNEVEDVVRPLIEDGKDSSYYSREEAIENLKGSYAEEALVVFILNEY